MLLLVMSALITVADAALRKAQPDERSSFIAAAPGPGGAWEAPPQQTELVPLPPVAAAQPLPQAAPPQVDPLPQAIAGGTTATFTFAPPLATAPPYPHQAQQPAAVAAAAQEPTVGEVAALRAEIADLRNEVAQGSEETWSAVRLIASTVDKDEREMRALTQDISTLRGRRGGGAPLVPTECDGRQSSCVDCLGSPGCVWCRVEQRCFAGDSSGPLRGQCSLWFEGTCNA